MISSITHIWSIEFGFISCNVIGVFSKGDSSWDIYMSEFDLNSWSTSSKNWYFLTAEELLLIIF